MEDDTTITPLHQPESIFHPLTEIARDGTRKMLTAALKVDSAGFVAQFPQKRLFCPHIGCFCCRLWTAAIYLRCDEVTINLLLFR